MKVQDLIGKEVVIKDMDSDGILLEDHSKGSFGVANATYIRIAIMCNGEATMYIEELVGKALK